MGVSSFIWFPLQTPAKSEALKFRARAIPVATTLNIVRHSLSTRAQSEKVNTCQRCKCVKRRDRAMVKSETRFGLGFDTVTRHIRRRIWDKRKTDQRRIRGGIGGVQGLSVRTQKKKYARSTCKSSFNGRGTRGREPSFLRINATLQNR